MLQKLGNQLWRKIGVYAECGEKWRKTSVLGN